MGILELTDDFDIPESIFNYSKEILGKIFLLFFSKDGFNKEKIEKKKSQRTENNIYYIIMLNEIHEKLIAFDKLKLVKRMFILEFPENEHYYFHYICILWDFSWNNLASKFI